MANLIIVDHTVIVERIIEVLKGDTNIYDRLAPKGKLRKIIFAEPDEEVLDDSTPFAYVSTTPRFQSTRESVGTMRGDFSQGLVEYQITIVTQKKQGSETQKELYKFLDLIVRAIRNNPKLGTPGDITTDEKVARLNVLKVEKRQPTGGKSLDAIKITLSAVVSFEWHAIFPTLGPLVLPMLSKPVDTIGVISDTDLCDDGGIAETKIADPGLIEIEFEEDKTTRETLETQINAGTVITVSIKRAELVDFGRQVFLKEIRNPVQFDTIERRILSMKVIS